MLRMGVNVIIINTDMRLKKAFFPLLFLVFSKKLTLAFAFQELFIGFSGFIRSFYGFLTVICHCLTSCIN